MNLKRCEFVRKLCGSILVLMVGACLTATAVAQQAGKPNIVWLTTEDNSANWYRLYNPKGAAMPNVERLASAGLVFNNSYNSGTTLFDSTRAGMAVSCLRSR